MLTPEEQRSSKKTATGKQVPVTMRAIVQRINRKRRLRAIGGSSKSAGGRGSISIATWANTSSSTAVETASSRRHVNPEELAKEAWRAAALGAGAGMKIITGEIRTVVLNNHKWRGPDVLGRVPPGPLMVNANGLLLR